MDKNQAVITFLKTCPTIQNNPLFFNFGEVYDNAYQANVKSDDVNLQKPYIDGSVLKRYTVYVDSFKSISYNPILQPSPTTDQNNNPVIHADENLEGMNEVQEVLDWITDKDELGEYPDFGENCQVDKMQVLTTRPNLVGIDTSANPPTAVYRISIQIDYMDYSKRLWI